ncbi:hypothetical protein C1893_23120 [Pseudomonas sp. MPR-ANC1]|uniref:hypothetical protein n=1 Tax=Pseudomonas sp. MPR-ANC1 TaxID=2075548 RepID=UPI000CD009F1|nr:hypothetical protein [Pseudomonas sp. MPR-ANC1]POA45550.1 hypothetical protein C1893_23120 [Pseudomonas sp. MPR-ANC1]
MSKSNIYAPDTTLAADEQKVGELLRLSRAGGAMLDSTSDTAVKAIGEAIKNPDDMLPARMAPLMAAVDEKHRPQVLASMLDGIRRFEYEHGFTPSADMIDSALAQGLAVADGSAPILPGGATLDSVSSSLQSTPLSHQPNRIAVAICGGLAESLPIGAYLPSDISSSESKLAIINSVAGSNYGAHKDGDILDGVNGGQSYIKAERSVEAKLSDDRATATFAFTTDTAGTGAAVPLIPTRTYVKIMGFKVAIEVNPNDTTASRQISGKVKIKNKDTQAVTDHNISGDVTFAQGKGGLAFTPALPAGTVVKVVGFIDYEAKPELTPSIKTKAISLSLFCTEDRVLMQTTPGARNQGQNELGADFLTVAVNAARRQWAQERYFLALEKLREVAANTGRFFDFDAANQLLQKSRAQRWRDFAAFMGEVDQEVANNTMEYGISYLFVGAKGASNFRTMGADDFTPSGVQARPSVYRVGRYKNQYDVYYTPRHVNENDTDLEMLAVGRAAQVARNPIVFSDALAPTLIPLGILSDLKSGAALYGRNLTEINPHDLSAMGCALITVKNVDTLVD